MISGVEKLQSGEVDIFVTSDLLEKQKVKASYEVTDVSGKKLTAGSIEFTANPRESKLIKTVSLKNIIAKYGTRNILVWLSLRKNNKQISENLVLFERPKYLELLNPKIKYQIKEESENKFTVRLESGAPALWAWIEVDKAEVRMSDNFFHLRKGNAITITITSAKKLTLSALKKNIKVSSLIDTF
jgi:hypothetical protein